MAITKACCAVRLAVCSSPAPTERAHIALVPWKRPIIREFTTVTAMPEMPTPAIEAAPSLLTQNKSMKGPNVVMKLVISIGQYRAQRLPIMLPCVQSRLDDVPLPGRLPVPLILTDTPPGYLPG